MYTRFSPVAFPVVRSALSYSEALFLFLSVFSEIFVKKDKKAKKKKSDYLHGINDNYEPYAEMAAIDLCYGQVSATTHRVRSKGNEIIY